MSKRFLSLLLAVVLCMSCLALPAFASDPYGPQESAFSLNGQNYSFCTVCGALIKAGEGSASFTDVAESDYFHNAVIWAVDKGITATSFGPEFSCTRAQIVTFLWRAAGSPSAGSGSAFTDVAQGDYFAAPVQWAVENAITSGTSNTTFSPNASCTRGQIVTFLYRTR